MERLDKQTRERIDGIVSLNKKQKLKELQNEIVTEIIENGFSIDDSVEYVRGLW